jgi:hypothetical protein
MRKIIVIFWVVLAVIASNCGNGSVKNSSQTALKTNNVGTTEILFREYQHDFGKVEEGEKVSYTFTFDNKGKSDLIISSATTTCGCTISRYDTKPISPGSSGNLEVVFDTSGRSGIETKTITVKSNASTPVVLLKITAEVVSTK